MIDRACQRRCALYSRYYNLNMLQSFPQLGTPRFIEYLADAMARRISYGVAGPTSDLRIDLFPPNENKLRAGARRNPNKPYPGHT